MKLTVIARTAAAVLASAAALAVIAVTAQTQPASASVARPVTVHSLERAIVEGQTVGIGRTTYVGVPLAAKGGKLRSCEDAITTAVEHGTVVTSGEYTPAIRRYCSDLSASQTAAASVWGQRMETLFRVG